jgi:hypothetical protein
MLVFVGCGEAATPRPLHADDPGGVHNGSTNMQRHHDVARIETPVQYPEPASMLLLGTGLVGLDDRRRRRR